MFEFVVVAVRINGLGFNAPPNGREYHYNLGAQIREVWVCRLICEGSDSSQDS